MIINNYYLFLKRLGLLKYIIMSNKNGYFFSVSYLKHVLNRLHKYKLVCIGLQTNF